MFRKVPFTLLDSVQCAHMQTFQHFNQFLTSHVEDSPECPAKILEKDVGIADGQHCERDMQTVFLLFKAQTFLINEYTVKSYLDFCRALFIQLQSLFALSVLGSAVQ